MRHPYLSRAATWMRRALGLDDLDRRLDAIESRLANAGVDRYPNGPVYFGDHTALVATRWGAKMLVDTRDAMVAPWLVLDGLWESTVTDWMQRTLQPGQVFVDVGANIGYFTLLGATLVGPQGRCVAVEAHPRLAELLQRNVIINGLHGYVTTWQRAAWSKTTHLTLHMRRNFASNSSIGSIGPEALRRLGDTEKTVDVEAVRPRRPPGRPAARRRHEGGRRGSRSPGLRRSPARHGRQSGTHHHLRMVSGPDRRRG
jgi:FkbM family methyltransferase